MGGKSSPLMNPLPINASLASNEWNQWDHKLLVGDTEQQAFKSASAKFVFQSSWGLLRSSSWFVAHCGAVVNIWIQTNPIEFEKTSESATVREASWLLSRTEMNMFQLISILILSTSQDCAVDLVLHVVLVSVGLCFSSICLATAGQTKIPNRDFFL